MHLPRHHALVVADKVPNSRANGRSLCVDLRCLLLNELSAVSGTYKYEMITVLGHHSAL